MPRAEPNNTQGSITDPAGPAPARRAERAGRRPCVRGQRHDALPAHAGRAVARSGELIGELVQAADYKEGLRANRETVAPVRTSARGL